MTIQFDFLTYYTHHHILNRVIHQIALDTRPVEGVSAYVNKNYQVLVKSVTLDRVRYDTNEVVLEVQWGKRKKTYDLIVPIPALELRMVETFRRQRLTDYLNVRSSSLEEEVVRKATQQGWLRLQAWSHTLKCPKAALDDECSIFVWEDGDVYSELEFVDGQVEYFTKGIGESESQPVAVDFPNMDAFLESPEAQDMLEAHSIGPIDPIGHIWIGNQHPLNPKKTPTGLDAPCPQPARGGRHEIYISRSLRSQYCRACGAVGETGDYGEIPKQRKITTVFGPACHNPSSLGRLRILTDPEESE